jgi:hypothetical protein
MVARLPSAISTSTNRAADNNAEAAGVQPDVIFASINHIEDVVACGQHAA